MSLASAVRFFRRHDEPMWRALNLARAEAFGESLGWRVEFDAPFESHQSVYGEPGSPDVDYFDAVLRDADGVILDSLGFVFDDGEGSLRFFRAELMECALASALAHLSGWYR